MKLANTEIILFNPLFTAKLILMALSGAKNNELKLELVYYILPLIYNQTIKVKLMKSTASSTFTTFLDQDVKRELIVIETLLNNYREKSKEALITLSNIVDLDISAYISLNEIAIHYSREKDSILRGHYKAAYNLGSILSNEDYSRIFFNI